MRSDRMGVSKALLDFPRFKWAGRQRAESLMNGRRFWGWGNGD